MIILICSSVGIAEELKNKHLMEGEPAPFECTCYNLPADSVLNLRLHEAEVFEKKLEEEAKARRRDWIIVGGTAGVLGFLLGILAN